MNKWSQERLELFVKANNGGKCALAKILKSDLAQEWIEWNIEARIRLDAVMYAASRTKDEAGSPRRGPRMDTHIAFYEKTVTESAFLEQFRDGMTTSCLELLFTAEKS